MEAFHALANILETYFSFERQIMATASFKTGASGSEEIVTEVDKEVEEICIKFLSSFFPEIPVLAEEHYVKGNTIPNEGWVFIIDPIDGTAEFSRGSHEWSISLSAVKNLKPYIGMLFMPQNNLRLSARKGEEVICNGERLSAKAQSGNARKIVVSPRQVQIPEFKSKIQRSGLKPIPVPTLTIKIVSILMGKADAGIYFSQEGKSANIWDYAAAILLLEEFGGKMTSLDGSAMPFGGRGIIHKDGWLATNRLCNHDELLKSLQ
ncbi:MAG TPA: inositol monophosphatase family protein [Candidatus Moranbacteria bacterium]|nr:inositol monophosphatase family protein [Candidatus Moranbacteria bacterium]